MLRTVLCVCILLLAACGSPQAVADPDTAPVATVTLADPQTLPTATAALADPTDTPPPTSDATSAPLPSLVYINTPGVTPSSACYVLPYDGDPVRIYIDPNFNALQIGVLVSPLEHLRTSGAWFEVALPEGTTSGRTSGWVSNIVAQTQGDCPPVSAP